MEKADDEHPTLSDKCVSAFNEVKDKTNRYIILKLDGGVLDVEEAKDWEATYNDFLTSIKKDDCRIGIITLKFLEIGNGHRFADDKIIRIFWNPEETTDWRTSEAYQLGIEVLNEQFGEHSSHTAYTEKELSF